MQTKSIIQFNGTQEELEAGCIGNGYTGFTQNPENPMEQIPQSINEFLSVILKTMSPYQFITNATFYWEKKLGVDNYNRIEMEMAMKEALTISVITE